MTRTILVVAALALTCAAGAPAQALSAKECSAKYQAAKQAGTLNGQKWADFRKVECGSEPDRATTTAPNPFGAGAKTEPAVAAPAPTTRVGSAVFPSAVSPKYASESAGKARQHTCLDQYNANKAAGGTGNGGLNWIQKGGGYYSACNKRLKG